MLILVTSLSCLVLSVVNIYNERTTFVGRVCAKNTRLTCTQCVVLDLCLSSSYACSFCDCKMFDDEDKRRGSRKNRQNQNSRDTCRRFITSCFAPTL